jgi:hypothetical protein
MSVSANEMAAGSSTILVASILHVYGNEITGGSRPQWSAPAGGSLLQLPPTAASAESVARRSESTGATA